MAEGEQAGPPRTSCQSSSSTIVRRDDRLREPDALLLISKMAVKRMSGQVRRTTGDLDPTEAPLRYPLLGGIHEQATDAGALCLREYCDAGDPAHRRGSMQHRCGVQRGEAEDPGFPDSNEDCARLVECPECRNTLRDERCRKWIAQRRHERHETGGIIGHGGANYDRRQWRQGRVRWAQFAIPGQVPVTRTRRVL